MRRPSKLAVAMHEAGHAVMWLSQPDAGPIASISLSHDSDDALGKVDVIPRWRPHAMLERHAEPEVMARWVGWAKSDISFFLAGPIAEWRGYSRAILEIGAAEMAKRCLGAPGPTFGTDLYQVRQRLKWIDSGNERQGFISAWLATEDAVANRRRLIERLGRLLAERTYLDEDDISRFWSAENGTRCQAD